MVVVVVILVMGIFPLEFLRQKPVGQSSFTQFLLPKRTEFFLDPGVGSCIFSSNRR